MSEIKICAYGLTDSEKKMLNGIVLISKRRPPTLTLLNNTDYMDADVIIIDGKDQNAMMWAPSKNYFPNRAVLWIDETAKAPTHQAIKRPVQWTQLPLILSKDMGNTPQVSNSQSADIARMQPQEQINPRSLQEYNLEHERMVKANQLTSDFSARQPNQAHINVNASNLQKNAQGYVQENSYQNTQQHPNFKTEKPNVLVVDDSQVVRDHLSRILQGQGYAVTTAENGSDALAIFDPNQYDLVLMDVVMPEMDGYEACRKLKSSTKGRSNIPVIMLTSKSSPFDRIRGKMAGCNAYLTKPVALGDLIKVLNTNLND